MPRFIGISLASAMGLALALGGGACAVSKVEPLTIPLAYKAPVKPDPLLTTISCGALSATQVTDERTDKLLGERFHESKPLKADVSAGSDPAVWVRDGMEQNFARAGFKTTPSSPALLIRLNALRTAENIWHRSGYEARILVTAQLQSPSGKSCWQESVEGKSGNYGYAGSIDNYQETLNAALDTAAVHLINSATFNAALCHCAD